MAIDSPCECEHNNPDSLDARLFPSVVLAVTPAVTMDEASSLSVPSVVLAVAPAVSMDKASSLSVVIYRSIDSPKDIDV